MTLTAPAIGPRPKPPSVAPLSPRRRLLLVFDGLVALRQRDWKPFLFAGGYGVIAYLIAPMPMSVWPERGSDRVTQSAFSASAG